MASLLKDFFEKRTVEHIAKLIASADESFNSQAFITDACNGLKELELLNRARNISYALRRHLSQDVPKALDTIVRALPVTLVVEENHSFSSFLYMPFTVFVADYGVPHYEEAMRANFELTQRFTAEFSIRPFLINHQKRTLDQLHTWAKHPNHHVRRLVSEGTRPRLPWASRLPDFQRDPTPVLELLELLKDDPSRYVTRSVANNLNDIGKDNPATLYAVVSDWLRKADENRRWVVRHALRSAIKRGEQGAFAALGYSALVLATISSVVIAPSVTTIGSSVTINFQVVSTADYSQHMLVDLAIHFVKSNGSSRSKVFKLSAFSIEGGASRIISKTFSLKQLSTRKHYPGRHDVDVMINGTRHAIGHFQLLEHSL